MSWKENTRSWEILWLFKTHLLLSEWTADLPITGLATNTILDHMDEICSPWWAPLIILDISHKIKHKRTRYKRQTLLKHFNRVLVGRFVLCNFVSGFTWSSRHRSAANEVAAWTRMLDTITIIVIFFCNKKLSNYNCAGFSVYHEYPELLLEFAGLKNWKYLRSKLSL